MRDRKRDKEREREREMLFSFLKGMTGALAPFIDLVFYKHYKNIVNTLCSKVMLVLYLTQAPSMCILISLCAPSIVNMY